MVASAVCGTIGVALAHAYMQGWWWRLSISRVWEEWWCQPARLPTLSPSTHFVAVLLYKILNADVPPVCICHLCVVHITAGCDCHHLVRLPRMGRRLWVLAVVAGVFFCVSTVLAAPRADVADHRAAPTRTTSLHQIEVSALGRVTASGPNNTNTSRFQAGVARATQLSFSEAPDRYPFIMEQILNVTHYAATTPLP
jgi:hypothetical protein